MDAAYLFTCLPIFLNVYEQSFWLAFMNHKLWPPAKVLLVLSSYL